MVKKTTLIFFYIKKNMYCVDTTATYPEQTPVYTGATITILPEVQVVEDYMIALRRHFHQNPELGFKEFETAKRIVQELRDIGIQAITESIAVTGIVAIIEGGAGLGPCVLLRADMDALPLQETAEIPYASVNAMRMHACGHDGHMASLLGAAKVLYAQRASLRGTIRLCFQPAEEGGAGGKVMVDEGVLEEKPGWGPRVDFVFGAHLWSFAALGQVGATYGPMMAAADFLDIEVNGKGGHGAEPHKSVDAIVVASHLVGALQTVVSRSIAPLEPGVVTIGQIQGGSGHNIIADKVVMHGTVRAFTTQCQNVMEASIRRICKGTATTFGCPHIECSYRRAYPPTINRCKASVACLNSAARKIVGDGAGHQFQTCAAEDFSFFLERRPGAFFFVGAGIPGPLRPHHKSVFDFDEKALGVTASVFVQLVRDLLSQDGPTPEAAAALEALPHFQPTA